LDAATDSNDAAVEIVAADIFMLDMTETGPVNDAPAELAASAMSPDSTAMPLTVSALAADESHDTDARLTLPAALVNDSVAPDVNDTGPLMVLASADVSVSATCASVNVADAASDSAPDAVILPAPDTVVLAASCRSLMVCVADPMLHVDALEAAIVGDAANWQLLESNEPPLPIVSVPGPSS
jgi:hypothetical protein